MDEFALVAGPFVDVLVETTVGGVHAIGRQRLEDLVALPLSQYHGSDAIAVRGTKDQDQLMMSYRSP